MALRIEGVTFEKTDKLPKNKPQIKVLVDDGISIEKVPGVISAYCEDGNEITFLWLKKCQSIVYPKDYPFKIDYESGKRIFAWRAGDMSVAPVVGEGTPGDFTLAQSVLDADPVTRAAKATKQEKFDWTVLVWPVVIVAILAIGMYLFQDYQKAKLPTPPVTTIPQTVIVK